MKRLHFGAILIATVLGISSPNKIKMGMVQKVASTPIKIGEREGKKEQLLHVEIYTH